MLRLAGVLMALAVLATSELMAQPQTVDVTGAWDVTITMGGRSVPGLAILSQDGSKITGMIGPALTDMMPADGTVEGNRLALSTRPRTGRTAAFAKSEATVTGDRMTGTIDTDKERSSWSVESENKTSCSRFLTTRTAVRRVRPDELAGPLSAAATAL
jgi:hypothetical protein